MLKKWLKLAYSLVICASTAHFGFAHLFDQLEFGTKQWKHAKEVLGRKEILNLDEHLLSWTKRSLKKKWQKSAHSIAKIILSESEKYDFDPIFILAIIKSESGFDPDARGSSGEIGLMQLVPKTAKWIASLYHLSWKGIKTLKDPVNNIRIGIAYLAHLRSEFSGQSQLYLAAYNMGSSNVQKALERKDVPQIYANQVVRNYLRYYTLLKNELKTQSQAYSQS